MQFLYKGIISRNKGDVKYEYSPLFNLYKENKPQIQSCNTDKFNFSLNNPVKIQPLFSYDGSVNLILNDNLNIPRLINSRFKMKENNTYEVPYHLNEVPTNAYTENIFDLTTRLQKQYSSIPKIEIRDLINDGSLSVGNYVFYIKYSDSDGNTTNIAAESGIISCFIGYNNQPRNIQGGYRNENSHKSIVLTIKNLDLSYSHLKVYYSRDTSDIDLNVTSEIFEINKLYKYTSDTLIIKITGIEEKKLITETTLNLQNFAINNAKTHTICLNRLFMANLSEQVDNVKELIDLSLRFYPIVKTSSTTDEIGEVKLEHYESKQLGEYYSFDNICNKVGYWNEEFYRFGIVYIYNSGKLSNVYNVRGTKNLSSYLGDLKDYINLYYTDIPVYKENGERNYIEYSLSDYNIINSNNENVKGVIRINESDSSFKTTYYFNFGISKDVIKELQKLNIIGFFIVRQKRIPTILCQSVLIPESKAIDDYAKRVPLIPIKSPTDNLYRYESFINDSGKLLTDYIKRIKYADEDEDTKAGICPEYVFNQPFYDSLFTGSNFKCKVVSKIVFNYNDRFIYLNINNPSNANEFINANILGIPDNTKARAIDSTIYTGVCGIAEEAFRCDSIGKKNTTKNRYNGVYKPTNNVKEISKDESNIIRGIFGSHLIVNGSNLRTGDVINIYIPDYDVNKFDLYLKIRYDDNSFYYSVSDRYSFDELYTSDNNSTYMLKDKKNNLIDIYRGDRFVSAYTWRMNRNFQDPSSPNNDIIIDTDTWNKYYSTDPKYIDELVNINRSDVNAVPLGTWIAIKCCTNANYNLRAIDKSYPSEKALTTYDRSFYPLSGINPGSYKIPDSNVFNKGYGCTVGHLRHANLHNLIYENTNYQNRIVYSEIGSEQDYRNSMRLFPESNYRDYNMEYGGITKILNLNDNLLCVFEHAIAIIPIKERVQTAGEGAASVYLNSDKVLPEKPIFISTEYGSLWYDSIVKTDSDRVYGVDTVAKKIWMISGQQIKLISDMVISEFLNNNVPLKELEVNTILGIKNVKTVYNAFKHDLMFTFYKPDSSKLETAWNLCYNDIQQEWVTFYSWIPEEALNISNVMYSMDRMSLRDFINGYEELKNDPNYNTYVEHINDERIEIDKEEKENPLYELINNYDNAIYKHGYGGIIDRQEKILPTHWYGKQHPFEFEFIVNDTPAAHKIFNNMRILSNKAKPESFHYEIIGQCYDFANDKKNAYYRQEAKKETFKGLGSGISYDEDYNKITPKQNPKSVSFPLYYNRIDRNEQIEDQYVQLTTKSKDYKNLSGTEVIHYDKLNEFRLQEHDKAYDIEEVGRLRGNMQYLEDFWNVQINPIILVEKNEDTWENGIPPIDILLAKIPNDLTTTEVDSEGLDLTHWNNRKEIKLKDKWMKVKIRYSGEDLAMISALYTMYSISYA